MYQIARDNNILRTTDAVFIPVDLGNADYQQYLLWLDEGNTPAPADAPSAVEIIETKKKEVRAIREVVLNRLSGIAQAAYFSNDNDTVQAYLVARQALLDLTKDLPVEPEAVELAFISRYQAIVQVLMQTAPSLITAFAGVDA